jgi:hypothetical protein
VAETTLDQETRSVCALIKPGRRQWISETRREAGMSEPELGTIRTDIPARLDRLPWAKWYSMVILGLGTVWILDGLEVTIVGTLSGQISKPGSGVHISQSQISGLAAALYVTGACVEDIATPLTAQDATTTADGHASAIPYHGRRPDPGQ